MLIAIVAVSIVTIIAIVSILSIACTVACSTISTILAITAIAIVIAIFSLRHINTIENNSHVRELLLVCKCINQVEALLWSIVCTTHIDRGICNARNLKSICNKTDWSGINHDIIISLLQEINDNI